VSWDQREPQGVTGVVPDDVEPTNAVFNLQGVLGASMTNELKFGYNAAKSTERGVAPAGFENIILNLSGSVANTASPGRARHPVLPFRWDSFASTAPATPLRSVDPYSLTFADS